MYFLVVRQKFTANVVVGLLGNESSDSNRFTLVTPKPENGVRLQATLGNQNPTGLPVRAVRLGPQVRHVEKKLKSVTTTPVEVINMRDYGMMNGEKVLDAALKILG